MRVVKWALSLNLGGAFDRFPLGLPSFRPFGLLFIQAEVRPCFKDAKHEPLFWSPLKSRPTANTRFARHILIWSTCPTVMCPWFSTFSHVNVPGLEAFALPGVEAWQQGQPTGIFLQEQGGSNTHGSSPGPTW